MMQGAYQKELACHMAQLIPALSEEQLAAWIEVYALRALAPSEVVSMVSALVHLHNSPQEETKQEVK